jgi:hypothetical protein
MSRYLAALDATQVAIFCAVFAIGLTGLLMPFGRYLITGWLAKRDDILDGLDADARVAYFTMFIRTGPPPDRNAAMVEFDRFYRRWYGRWHFLGPGLLYGAAAIVVCVALTTSGLLLLAVLPPLPTGHVPTTALAALGGAYLWVANDLISRARRLDFAPADIQWAALRLVIAIPMGYAFGHVLSASLAAVVAFGLGAFPLSGLISMLARATDKALGQDLQSTAARNDIGHLQGVNKPIIERLADEDITTVTQIAYCDPVQIAMRSALPFVFVTDLMNQSLAWIYFEKHMAVLRSLGLRGACEIKDFIDDYDGAGQADGSDTAEATATTRLALPRIAARLGQDEASTTIAFRQIAGDPYTQFLVEVWTSPFEAATTAKSSAARLRSTTPLPVTLAIGPTDA